MHLPAASGTPLSANSQIHRGAAVVKGFLHKESVLFPSLILLHSLHSLPQQKQPYLWHGQKRKIITWKNTYYFFKRLIVLLEFAFLTLLHLLRNLTQHWVIQLCNHRSCFRLPNFQKWTSETLNFKCTPSDWNTCPTEFNKISIWC